MRKINKTEQKSNIHLYSLEELKQLRKQISGIIPLDDLTNEQKKCYSEISITALDELIKTKEEITKRLAGRISTIEGLKQQRKEFSNILKLGNLAPLKRNHYKTAIIELDKLIKNPSDIYLTQGIDTMMIDIIQFRAIIYAFESFENLSFLKTKFFESWHVGMTYAIFSLFGKLVDKRNDVESLLKVWEYVYRNPYFPKDGNTNLLIRGLPRAKLLRNKIVAHNDKSGKKHNWLKYNWNRFDDDLKQLVSAWHILSKFSGSLLMFPFAPGEEMFNGLDFIFKPRDMQILVKKYDEFIAKLDHKNGNFLQNITVARHVKP